VSGDYAFNCDGFLIALHCSLSIQRFYEPAGNIVNDITKLWYDALRWPRRAEHPSYSYYASKARE